VISLGAAQVSVDTSRVAGLWCQAGEPGELISAGEGGHVTAGGSEEFCTQPGTDAGQAGDYLGVPMFAKSGLDKLIQLCDFVIKGDHPLGQPGDHLGGQALSGQHDRLGAGRLHRGLGQRGGVTHTLFAQPRFQARDPGAADRRGGLVTGQQHQRAFVGQCQCAFQCGEYLEQLRAQPVDLAGAIEHHIYPARGQDTQIHSDLISGPQHTDIPADTGLISDDERVTGIGFTLAAVAGCRTVNSQPGQIGHRLLASNEQADHQRRRSVVEVDRPQHLPVCESNHLINQRGQLRLVVDHSSRQKSPALVVDHHTVMMFLSDIDSRPNLFGQRHPIIAPWTTAGLVA
jgi:hypothetical protein